MPFFLSEDHVFLIKDSNMMAMRSENTYTIVLNMHKKILHAN